MAFGAKSQRSKDTLFGDEPFSADRSICLARGRIRRVDWRYFST